ncbi:MAG: flagellin [bacterium]|nr:flagellin [bacterium]
MLFISKNKRKSFKGGVKVKVRITTNVIGMQLVRQLNLVNSEVGKRLERISSGYRINSASDDAACLGISEHMRTQIKGLEQGYKNSQDTISLLEVAEGGMQEIHTILHRLRKLAITSANDTLISKDRKLIQNEVDELLNEVDRLSSATNFNTRQVLRDYSGERMSFHLGANKDEVLRLKIDPISCIDLGINSLKSEGVTTRANAEEAIGELSDAIMKVSKQRVDIGAIQNVLGPNMNPIMVSRESQMRSESILRDAKFSDETMALTKDLILQDFTNAMCAQANTNPKSILQILT